MNARDLFDRGDVKGTIATLTQAVRSNPADQHLRSFLFEMLCFDGDFSRAVKQLEALSTQAGPKSAIAFRIYRSLIDAEVSRRRVFAGETLPKFYGTPPEWLEAAIVLLGKMVEAAPDTKETAARAESTAPSFTGRWNGEPFALFRDSDDRTAFVLEVFRGEDYLWLPFSQLKRIDVSSPVRLRDLLWMHAKVETTDGSSGDFYIPARYTGSDQHTDDAVRLGRTTDWTLADETVLCGSGHRMFSVDDREVSLLDTRTIEFDHREAQA